ncbi:MAG: hypothetical protein AVDCRST_MAG68-1148, partial [uncultured Gemmatimonadetes bacterium]
AEVYLWAQRKGGGTRVWRVPAGRVRHGVQSRRPPHGLRARRGAPAARDGALRRLHGPRAGLAQRDAAGGQGVEACAGAVAGVVHPGPPRRL